VEAHERAPVPLGDVAVAEGVLDDCSSSRRRKVLAIVGRALPTRVAISPG